LSDFIADLTRSCTRSEATYTQQKQTLSPRLSTHTHTHTHIYIMSQKTRH